MTDLTGANWRKSTRSDDQGNCVEVADNLPGVVGVRDSKNLRAGVLVLSPEAFRSLVQFAKEQ